jgi:hypothetical protein
MAMDEQRGRVTGPRRRHLADAMALDADCCLAMGRGGGWLFHKGQWSPARPPRRRRVVECWRRTGLEIDVGGDSARRGMVSFPPDGFQPADGRWNG